MFTVHDYILFDDLGTVGFLALLAGYFVAFTIKGVFGYGAVPPMIMVGSLVMPPHDAVILAALVNLGGQGLLIPDGVRHGDARIAARSLVLILPTLFVGVVIFDNLPREALELFVGAFLLAFLLLDGSTPQKQFFERFSHRPRLLAGLSAVLAGLIAGVIGAGAMILFGIWLRSVIQDRQVFRGTIILVVTGLIVVRMTFLFGFGLITVPLVLEAASLVPLALAGLSLGRLFTNRMTDKAYFSLFRAFMIVGCITLIVRALL